MEHSVEEVKLSSGAKGLVIRSPGVKVVEMLIEFRAGFDIGPVDKYELPHVAEHMMFTNKSFPKPRQFSIEVEKSGAYHNASTSTSSLEYDYECAEFEADRIADLIRVQLTEPLFLASELKTELSNVREELSKAMSDNQRVVSDHLFAVARHAPEVSERAAQLPKITAQDLKQFYEKTHLGQNMRFIVAGDTDFDPILQKLDIKLPKGHRFNLPQLPMHKVEQPLVTPREVDQIYYTFFSSRSRPYTYRELVAARIIISVLTEGFSSTLFGLARERGLVYSLGMGANSDLYETGTRLGGFVTPQNAQALFKLIHAQLAAAKAGRISERQFKATKELMRGQRAIAYQRASNLVSYYAMYFEKDEIEDFENFNRYLGSITKAEAVAAFAELFSDDTWGISFLGAIAEPLAAKLTAQITPLWRAAA